jgi:DNA-binding transcriptional MerR regulator
MEIKATLNKPYTDKERIDFVVANNHKLGYQIKETETALEAWGYTQEEIAEQAKQAQIAELVAQLDALDLKTIRSMRAIQAADFTDDDVAYLQQLEQQAKALREQLSALDD